MRQLARVAADVSSMPRMSRIILRHRPAAASAVAADSETVPVPVPDVPGVRCAVQVHGIHRAPLRIGASIPMACGRHPTLMIPCVRMAHRYCGACCRLSQMYRQMHPVRHESEPRVAHSLRRRADESRVAQKEVERPNPNSTRLGWTSAAGRKHAD